MSGGGGTALIMVIATAAAAWWPQADADQWEERLEALSPADPMAYFELAEEVADEPGDGSQLALARHLFGLSGALAPQRLGRSACLAIADLEPNEYAKRRMIALGTLLDRRAGGLIGQQPGGAAPIHPEAALAVSEAISYYRKGDGARALKALDQPGAMDLLDAWGSVVFRGGATRFVEDCRLYRGARKPTLTPQDQIAILRFEAAILAGNDRAWSGDLLLTEGRPLIEVDPDRTEEVLGVDGSRPCYRNGHWVTCD
ncbi:MAG: hypothetical protein ACYSU7_09145 [Planctomycetota bacterium]|jgi:hypothetical protein